MANEPIPITRQDQYYNYLINGGDINKLDKPVTRIDNYLYYICVNGFGGGGTVTPEQIQAAVDAYLEENPVEPGATEEQATQIEENKENIEQLQKDLEEVFTSVSNGKGLIASAITDKGVETDATDTFATMAQNIGEIQTGGGGIPYLGEYEVTPSTEQQTLFTSGKTMSDDVTIKQIPTYEVSNESGTTFIIGGNS